jgi:hypothetical protein
MLTCRALHVSRAAIWSTPVMVPLRSRQANVGPSINSARSSSLGHGCSTSPWASPRRGPWLAVVHVIMNLPSGPVAGAA